MVIISGRDDVVVNVKKMVINKIMPILCTSFAVGCLFIGGANSYKTQALTSESSESVKEIYRGRISGDILCSERLRIFPEEKFTDENGKELYSRVVEIGKEFKKTDVKSSKIVASHTSKIKFTYDKKSFVKIDDPDKDIEENETGGSWSVMDVKEIFPSDEQCLVSTRCVLYKENSLRVKNYVLSSHYDVFCSLGGKIGVNTELH